ncbi:hypothetical protein F442_18235 [Phytophthora nicotianae P10297]|uniref:RxLR effector protein n=4 Tax=Phytophthora nicotianae TaxID=4792 RepID=V9E9I1_PHYNI|nr:hypothetical protein F443_18408 [Phytophthora nicotianae P1569]ETO63940.1 hypothetical protein F444_18421 [Phytophthora nicotianae P1976]ETP33169.1 hypothetical protein F442_18235 [Phytophthora nicotianae P10297]KUF85838.1 Avh77 [Phytophthora nicotianae]
MRLGYLLLVTTIGLLACGDTLAALSKSQSSKLTAFSNLAAHEQVGDLNGNRDNKRALRVASKTEEADSSDDPASAKDLTDSDDEEERDLIISTWDRPKYRRWFHDGMTPYDVQHVLGLTGVRRLWKPIKRRVYKGYVVYYTEKCNKAKYHDFCKQHADK